MSRPESVQLKNYSVIVDYSLSHKEQVEAAQFDWIPNSPSMPTLENPTKHFFSVPDGKLKQQVTLLGFHRSVVTAEVVGEMYRLKMRSAVAAEGLAFVRDYPHVKVPIVCLGSFWFVPPDNRPEVLCFDEDSDGRYPHLRWIGSQWDKQACFLAVLV